MDSHEPEMAPGFTPEAKGEKASAKKEPRTPVLQPGKHKDTATSMSRSSDDSGRKKRKKIIKFENQEEDTMSTLKKGLQQEQNLKCEGERMVKTEGSETEATGSGIGKTPAVTPLVPVATVEETVAHDSPLSPVEETVHSDILSTLVGPPQAPDTSGLTAEMLQGFSLAIPPVKNALIKFLTAAKPNDVVLMIAEANHAFSTLDVLNADYRSFYDTVRSYILHCSELFTAGKELKENMEGVKLLSRRQKLSYQSIEAERAVSDIEAELVKANQYITPLEARVQETKDLLNKHEAELQQRRTEVASLEAEKILRMEALAAVDVEAQAIAAEVEEVEKTLKDILRRQETAKAAVEDARAQLSRS